MATLKKLIPTYIEKEQDGKTKYIPAYKLGDDEEPKPISWQGELLIFDTPEEALKYLNYNQFKNTQHKNIIELMRLSEETGMYENKPNE